MMMMWWFDAEVNTVVVAYCCGHHICTMVCIAFCPEEITNTTRGSYFWPRTEAENNLTSYCVYGTIDGINSDKVRRNCSDRGVWFNVELEQCLTFSNSLLRNVSSVCYKSYSLMSRNDCALYLLLTLAVNV